MGWTAARDWVADELVSAAICNTHIRDQLKYLKGQAGEITFESQILVQGQASFTGSNAVIEIGSSTASNTPGIDLHSGGSAVDYDVRLQATGGDGSIGNGALGLYAAGGISANQMRVHRHPYSNDRHIESGNASIGANTSTGVTFTNAYSSAPNVASAADAANEHANIQSVTTTGFTLYHGGAGTAVPCYWIAEGPD